MDEETEPPKKQVLHPATAAARRHDRQRAYGGHVRGHTVRTSEVLDLMRQHRKHGIISSSIQIIPAAIAVISLQMVPELRTWQPVGPIPFAWLALGPVALGSIVVSTIFSERKAIKIDERWAEETS